ncbi:hypothetical protein BDW74DRAFT_166070 [Aspergillus multicolor]|uniref:uncharacterized protein n=1 Tax=Aspergillus multicolor TaxID=41759 RepID=UPI003CCCFBB8
MSVNEIRGRLALITGASGGIGAACAHQLASHGVHLALTYSTNSQAVNELVAELSSRYDGNNLRITTHQVDVGSPDQIETMFQQIDEQHGHRPDILISNAGYGKRLPNIWDISLEEFDYMLNINLRASFVLVKGVVEHMKSQRWGRIVFMSSIAASGGGINGCHYAASKGGLTGMMKNLSTRLAEYNISVNDVAPAMIGDTGMVPSATAIPGIASNIPLRRLGTPEETANVVAMLVKTGYMTGQSLLLAVTRDSPQPLPPLVALSSEIISMRSINMPKSVSRRSGVSELRAVSTCKAEKQVLRDKSMFILNLDAAESRCASLLSLLRHLNPNVDVENALGTVAPETGYQGAVEPLEPEPESESPGSSHDFEWNEAYVENPPDGMVSLPTARADSGYLGNSSGTRLLQTISDLLPENTNLSQHQQQGRSPARASQTGSPSLLLHFANTAVLDNLVDAYFLWYNRSYPILHERTFREKYRNRQQIHSRSSWHLIFYLVLAIGHWVSTGCSELNQDSYYMAARSRMSMRMLECGSLVAVQAFLLMGNYLQKRDRPNTGYNYIGIAYRMALGLGLHREPPTGQINNTLFNERRRAVWWVVYCFDSGFSLTTGRPVMASDSFIETRLPLNIDDSTIPLDSPLPPPSDQPTTYSAIIAHARLVSIGNRIFSEIISGPYRDNFSLKSPRSIDHQLKAWRLSLPSYFSAQDIPPWFRGPRAIVGWKEQNLRMLLWWGSQRLCADNLSMSVEREEAQNTCHFTAVETIQNITTFCLDYADIIHIGLSWYATYFLFQASVVLSIHHLRPVPQVDGSLAAVNRELWLSSIERARACFASLGTTNRAALRCLAVLDRIRDRSPGQPTQHGRLGDLGSVYPTQTEHVAHAESEDTAVAPLAIDPTLQMFFEDTSWESTLFEGLNGFPGTDEVDVFGFVPANTEQTMPAASDLNGPGL